MRSGFIRRSGRMGGFEARLLAGEATSLDEPRFGVTPVEMLRRWAQFAE